MIESVMDRSPQSPYLNIIEVVWDYLEKERNKKLQHPKKESFKKPREMFLETT